MSKLKWINIRQRKLKCKFFTVLLFSSIVIVALVLTRAPSSVKTDLNYVPGKAYTVTVVKETTKPVLTKKAQFCNQIPTRLNGTKWKTVQGWNYRLYKRPQFLPNFKNPCYYMTNRTGQIRGNVSNRVAGSDNTKLRCLPYFIIAGFPKSGTTDLWARLISHPDIKARHMKEPFFFSRQRLLKNFGRFDHAVEKYTAYFDETATALQEMVSHVDNRTKSMFFHHGITGEGSVDTSFDNRLWKRYPGNELCSEPVITNADYVHQVNPNIKVIFVVRNPTERLYSDYIFEARFLKYQVDIQLFHYDVVAAIQKHMECREQYNIRACAYNDTLETFKIRLRVGMYHIFISDWLEMFPKENILVINNEDTVSERMSATYKKVLQFLDLRPFTKSEELTIFKGPNANRRRNSEAGVGEMLAETRKLIDNFYEPFNEKLVELYPDIDYNKKIKQKGDRS